MTDRQITASHLFLQLLRFLSLATSSAFPPPEVSPVPAGPIDLGAARAAASHDELVIEMGPRRWRVRHIAKAPTPGVLRVNVMVGAGERFHVDTVDLYSAKQRAAYIDAAKTELRADRDTIAAELGRVLLATEDAQAAAAAPTESDGVAAMTTAERGSRAVVAHGSRSHGPGGRGVRHPRSRR